MEGNPNQTEQAGKPHRSHEMRGILLVLLGVTCWGFSATCVSFLVDRNGVDVPWLACVRLFVSGLLFLIIALIKDRDKFSAFARDKTLIRDLIVYILVAVVMMQLGYMSCIKLTNAGTALLLMEISVPMVLIVECVRNRRAPRLIEYISVALAAIGVVFIATQGNLGTIAINPLGLMWGLFTAVANAGYILIPRRLVKECGTLVLNGVAFFSASFLFMPFARPWETPAMLDAQGWLVFAGIVLIGTMLAYAAFLQGAYDAGPVIASLIGVFEPVSGAVISALWLGTVFSGWDMLGGLCIITMMILVALKK